MRAVSGSGSFSEEIGVNTCDNKSGPQNEKGTTHAEIDVGGEAIAKFWHFNVFQAELMGGGYVNCTNFFGLGPGKCCVGFRVFFKTCFWNQCYTYTIYDINNCQGVCVEVF
jgi:hypothetical protein